MSIRGRPLLIIPLSILLVFAGFWHLQGHFELWFDLPLAIIDPVVAAGLWLMKSWARRACILLSFIYLGGAGAFFAIAASMKGIFQFGGPNPVDDIRQIHDIAISIGMFAMLLILLYYFMREDVKRSFS
jgi:hypothetical protein